MDETQGSNIAWFCCEHFEELPELVCFTADGHPLPRAAESCVFVLAWDNHGALLHAALSPACGGRGN